MLLYTFPSLALLVFPQAQQPDRIFDGVSLSGWEASDKGTWRAEDGNIVGGSLERPIPSNSYLFSAAEYSDFELKFQFKLVGFPEQGMVNSGVQFRSQRLEDGHARGYQADIGDPAWWGSIYDEQRRNRVIAASDMSLLEPVLNRGDWNDYVIRCEGSRIRLWINGVETVDYTETESGISRTGRIALQIHSGGPAQVSFRDITLLKIKSPESPLSPADQLASFSVPDGFVVELVASEETGLPKPITVQFDDAGRMWSITATEYPLDANESPEEAQALWRQGGRDRVVVIDRPHDPGPHVARTFVDGLAMPMGLLPWKDGVVVGQGTEVLFIGDENGDGTGDHRLALLTGFGVQDSHLMPHQFTLMPGGWISMAQGAFNYSEVVAGSNAAVTFNYCKLGRFRPDGSKFEITGFGLNNIWGFVLGREGEVFAQEANDMKYSVVPFQNGTTYPGIGNEKFRPYAPIASPITDFHLGGTGLSGLAYSDFRSGSFPAPWNSVMFVANPITGTINAVRIEDTEGGGYSTTRLPDFLSSTDDWFRPIAINFGPDGCLYVVDWYNKIISHNEVPREHPARDKGRGRVWRVRHLGQTPRQIPDLTQVGDLELPGYLSSDSTWEMRAAWHQIIFRQPEHLTSALEQMVRDEMQPADARIHALWSLASLGAVDVELSLGLLKSSNRNLRREALGVQDGWLESSLVEDPDPQVRAEAIRSLARQDNPGASHIAELVRFAKPSVEVEAASGIPWGGRHGTPVPSGPAYDREFERFLVRMSLEQHPVALAAFLDSQAAEGVPAENLLFATLALPSEQVARYFLSAWREVERLPDDEELLLLLRGSVDPELRPLISQLFSNPASARSLMLATLRLRSRLELYQLEDVLTAALQELLMSPGQDALLVEMVVAFKLKTLKEEVVHILSNPENNLGLRADALNALRRIGAGADSAVMNCLTNSSTPKGLRLSALAVVGASGDSSSSVLVIDEINKLSVAERAGVVEDLSSSADGARLLLGGVVQETLPLAFIPPQSLERMSELLPDNPVMQKLWEKEASTLPSALHLFGKPGQFSATQLSLSGPFTVEVWVRLAEGISNADGILGCPGGADLNFHDSRARFYGGPAVGDLVIANRTIVAGIWTHVAVSRDPEGIFRVFLDGELDNTGTKQYIETFSKLDLGRTSPPQEGTHGKLLEFRVWNYARSNLEIRSSFRRKLFTQDTIPWRPGLPTGDYSIPPEGLVNLFPQGGDPTKLQGGARIIPLAPSPKLLTRAAAARQEQELSRFRAMLEKPGDAKRGEPLFRNLCLSCHTVGGEGAGVAPPLDGSSHRDLDSLLRAIATPNAAFEPGYRTYRLETFGGEMYEGYLVKQDEIGTTIGFMGGAQVFVESTEIRRGRFLDRSFMPPGLLDALDEQMVADLFAKLSSLD